MVIRRALHTADLRVGWLTLRRSTMVICWSFILLHVSFAFCLHAILILMMAGLIVLLLTTAFLRMLLAFCSAILVHMLADLTVFWLMTVFLQF